MILESNTPAVTQFSVNGVKKGDKFKVLFPVFNRAEGLKVSVRKKDGSLEELKLNQDYSVLIPSNSGQAGYTAEVEYIGEERDVYVFIVERVIRLSQETNLSSYGAEGRNQEFSLDKLTCILQDTRTGLCISSSEVNNPLTGTPKLELPYNRENSILTFDENRDVEVIKKYSGGENTEIDVNNVINVHISGASSTSDGLMSKGDKVKVDGLREVAFSGLNESSGLRIKDNVLNLNAASVASRGGIRIMPQGVVINNLFQTIGDEAVAVAALPPAGNAADKLGGVFIDSSDEENLSKTDEEGKLTTILPTASGDVLGGVRVGKHLRVSENGTLHAMAGVADLAAGENVSLTKASGVSEPVKGSFASIIFAHGLYVAVGTGIIAKSLNGRDWTPYKVKDLFPAVTEDLQLQCVVSDSYGFKIIANYPAYVFFLDKNFKPSGVFNHLKDAHVTTMCFLYYSTLYVIAGAQGVVYFTDDFVTYYRSSSVLFENRDWLCSCTVGREVLLGNAQGEIFTALVDTDFRNEHVAKIIPWGSITSICKTPKGIYATTSQGEIYYSEGLRQPWILVAQPTTQFLSAFGSNDTDYYAAGTEGLFSSYNGKNWEQVALNSKYSFYVLHVTDDLILAAGTENDDWQRPYMYMISLGDVTVSATDTTYDNATTAVSGLMSAEDKVKLDTVQNGAEVNVQSDWNEPNSSTDAYIKNRPNLSKVALSNNYNELDNKLVGGENIRIDENNVISASGGDITAGAGLQKTGNEISLKAASVNGLGGVKVGANLNINAEGSISGIPQVNSDWDSSAGVSQIMHKPILSDVATSGHVEDLMVYSNIDIAHIAEVILPSNQSWRSVCYGAGTFVAVANGSNVGAYSTDGITWKPMPMLPSSKNWRSVCYGAGKFVAVASDSIEGAYSTDGITWKPMPMLPSSKSWRSVCYGAGKFVAVAENSIEGAYSTDGITWTSMNMPSNKNWYSVCYGVGKFVAVSFSESSAVSIPLFADNLLLSNVAISGSYNDLTNKPTLSTVAISGKYEDLSGKPVIPAAQVNSDWNSSSGVAQILNKPVLSLVATSGSYNDLSNKPTNATTAASGLMSAEDKVKLDTVQNGAEVNVQSDWNVSDTASDACIKNKPNVVDNVTSSSTADVLSANQGKMLNDKIAAIATVNVTKIDVTHMQIVDLKRTARWSAVTYGNDRFVAVVNGTDEAYGTDKYAHSADGINWTPGILPTSAHWTSICYGSSRFVAVAGGSKLVHSVDGVNWTAGTLPTGADWSAVTYGSSRFVAVAYGTDKYAHSADGINWTQGILPASANWKSICYGNGRFVAVAYGTYQYVYSDNGVNWTQGILPASANWKSICYGNGRFVAVAYGTDQYVYSDDGVNWIKRTILPRNATWQLVTYGGGLFIAVCYNSDVLVHSADGISWAAGILPTSAHWTSICYGNGKFVIVNDINNDCAFIPLKESPVSIVEAVQALIKHNEGE